MKKDKSQPFVLYIAEKIYFHILEIKKKEPNISNIEAIERFIGTEFYDEISSSYLEDRRCILFITGMGLGRMATTSTNKKLFYGKIRSNIQNWAEKPEHKNKILSYTRAHISHGGEGSFYVYLRKKNKI